VRLERARPLAVGARVDASTPRRCVWNSTSYWRASATTSLQPLEGASGTASRRASTSASSTLQPLEGASGTPQVVRVFLGLFLLQPLEGASGTPVAGRRECSIRPASTPRRCVWNAGRHVPPFEVVQLQPLEGASGTPRSVSSYTSRTELQPLEGASGTSRVSRLAGCGPCFNPSKVRLELPSNRMEPGLFRASTPRRCVWNIQRGIVSIGVDRASTPRRCVWNDRHRRRSRATGERKRTVLGPRMGPRTASESSHPSEFRAERRSPDITVLDETRSTNEGVRRKGPVLGRGRLSHWRPPVLRSTEIARGRKGPSNCLLGSEFSAPDFIREPYVQSL